MNKRYALYEERGDLLERKAISEKYTTGWYLQEKLEEINEQIRVIENVTPQAQKTYFEILAEPAIEVTPWDEIPDAVTIPPSPWRYNAKTIYTRGDNGLWTNGFGVFTDYQIAAMFDKWINPQRSDRGDYVQQTVYWNGDKR